MLISDLDTPSIIVDLDIMDRNLSRMADYAREHNLLLRPHTKTHKIPELARKQLDCGAAGITVAKVGEAEVMAAAHPPNMLVEYPIIGRGKIERLAQVASHTPVTIAVDSIEAARQLSSANQGFGLLVEIDVGMGRIGVRPGEQLQGLLRGIVKLPHLDFQGISFFPGHVLSAGEETVRAFTQIGRILEQALDDVHAMGLSTSVVSGGNTPTAAHSHLLPGLTEIRSGTYIFNDRNTLFSGACAVEDCAAWILTTIVSTAVPDQVIVDAGSKTLSSDAYWGTPPSHGHVLEAPQAVFSRLSEEHGFVNIRATGRTFQVGETVRVIPNHICPAVNLQDRVYGIRGDHVEAVLEVAARGKLQ